MGMGVTILLAISVPAIPLYSPGNEKHCASLQPKNPVSTFRYAFSLPSALPIRPINLGRHPLHPPSHQLPILLFQLFLFSSHSI